ncbi:hypothetical protein TKK_0004946 [Trichogramma kaykai]|uniref:Elongation factor 1-delta n=1 Tax=Trichogramma kaykai TaxID=54128 RepID=A0ABD2XJ28_9HYME
MAAVSMQEKVWSDKSTYDRAERLHHERLAKVLPEVIMADSSNNQNSSAINELEAVNTPSNNKKSKSKKAKENKDNKVSTQDNSSTSEVAKPTKNSKKNKKKEEAKEAASAKNATAEITDAKNEEVEQSTPNVGKKNKAKDAKEKKNIADKNHRLLEDTKSIVQDVKEPISCQELDITMSGSLAAEVAKARQHIKLSLQVMDGIAALAGLSVEKEVPDKEVSGRLVSLEKENQELRNIVQDLKNMVVTLDSRVKGLEGSKPAPAPAVQVCPAKPAAKPAAKPSPKEDDDDEDVDLFGSDSEGESEEAAKIREERLAAYNAKKSKKPALIAKSNIILDVKPWDDETDMKVLEAEVRKIACDGLLWGAAKLVPVAFNIKKLQISCVVEDDKVSVDWLTETIQEIEDYVQSVDIAAFNKV